MSRVEPKLKFSEKSLSLEGDPKIFLLGVL
jgi:hypothetical protein